MAPSEISLGKKEEKHLTSGAKGSNQQGLR